MLLQKYFTPFITLSVVSLTAFSAFAQSEQPPVVSSSNPNVIIILTDDHGWPDLGAQGILDDVKTPHTDKLAASGVRFTSGYSSAPQCRPARAGLMAGRNQSRFGLEDNRHLGFPWAEYTIAERLRDAGYVTGMSGKWHLNGSVDSTGKRPDGSDATDEEKAQFKTLLGKLKADDPGQVQHHGFMEHFSGSLGSYVATHSADGSDLGGVVQHPDRRYRVDVQAEWGVNFIKRHAASDAPFFLYLSLYAPHVPLEAPQHYIDRFPGEMPERRRLALAMIASIDDAVGQVAQTLTDEGIADNTLIFYMADNGAPLKYDKEDAPGGGPGWDGSLNDPWIGEKGMLTEGGIRVPFVASWPAKIPGGQVDDRPVISFDAIATAVAAAGQEVDDRLDGVDLLPYLDGRRSEDPHEMLHWRWAGQYAVRSGNWKYLKAGERNYLFDVTTDQHEAKNLIEQYPERADALKLELAEWSNELYDAGFDHPVGYQGDPYFDFYLDGKPRTSATAAPTTNATSNSASTSVPRSQRIFIARDVNKDRVMTLEEYIGNPKGRNVPALQRNFKSFDKNGDGQVTLAEMEDMAK
ncbi:MAG: arylsulfatase A-like enzyme [Candidatus Binatia bacterium]|jgi:arylsulfatase A-like enzyme